jgi:hypothetical protein
MVTAALLAAALAPGCQAELVRRVERHVVRTAIVCDGAVVRRARRTGAHGREITDVAAAAGRLAWGELRRTRGRWTARVAVGRIRGGRTVAGRARDVAHGKRRPRLRVVLTSRGDVAWLAGHRIVAWRRGGSLRAIARRAAFNLALEDDRTLRWSSSRYAPHFHDLRPWPRGRCPQRSRYRTIAENAHVVVTEAFYDGEYTPQVVRGCLRGHNRDHVLATGQSDFGSANDVTVPALYEDWVVVAERSSSRYDNCGFTTFYAIDPRSLFRGRSGGLSGCDPEGPQAPLVVTEHGAVAWIARNATRSALFTGGGLVITLDTAGPDGITGLVAEGTGIRWLHDGEPRAADLG